MKQFCEQILAVNAITYFKHPLNDQTVHKLLCAYRNMIYNNNDGIFNGQLVKYSALNMNNLSTHELF